VLRYHRGERRYHRSRLLKVFFLEERPYMRNEHGEWAVRNARLRVNTRTLCSCALCCTPRKTHGNSLTARTFQEQRFIQRLRDEE
jgi:hypothetical protein